MIGAHKKNMCGPSEYVQPPYFYLQLPCVSVCVNGSTEGNYKKRICAAWGLWTYMLPRELNWERVAPSHTGVIQLSDWPELHAMWSAPESPHKAWVVRYINVVSLSLITKCYCNKLLNCHKQLPEFSENNHVIRDVIVVSGTVCYCNYDSEKPPRGTTITHVAALFSGDS